MSLIKQILEDNVIPPITNALGYHWRQPDRKEIRLDGKFAYMRRITFQQLHEYSGTVPTGVYAGKMWRRDLRSLDNPNEPEETRYELCWYSDSPRKESVCEIQIRTIIFI